MFPYLYYIGYNTFFLFVLFDLNTITNQRDKTASISTILQIKKYTSKSTSLSLKYFGIFKYFGTLPARNISLVIVLSLESMYFIKKK